MEAPVVAAPTLNRGVAKVAAKASKANGARSTYYTIERRPAVGINLATCLMARRLIGSFDFLRPDGQATSSLFLFAKTGEGMLG